jgi:hypothetical protein
MCVVMMALGIPMVTHVSVSWPHKWQLTPQEGLSSMKL